MTDKFKLGKRAPRLDKRTLKFANYLPKKVVPPLPTPPPNCGYIDKIANFPMLSNDSLGDCVEACQLHMVQQWTAYASTEVVPSDADAIKLYSEEGGYVPGDPTTDNGTDMLTALRYWKNNGISVGSTKHKIAAYMSLDTTNKVEIQQAVMLFGNIFLGVALPISAQTPSTGVNGLPVWNVPSEGPYGDGSPGGWGGHAIPVVGFGVDKDGNYGVEVVTWGSLYDVTYAFLANYADEAYVVLSTDWIEKSGLSPSQFNMAQLQQDLQQL